MGKVIKLSDYRKNNKQDGLEKIKNSLKNIEKLIEDLKKIRDNNEIQ